MQTAEPVEEILLKVKREGGIFSGFRAKSGKRQFLGPTGTGGFSRCKLPISRKISKIVK